MGFSRRELREYQKEHKLHYKAVRAFFTGLVEEVRDLGFFEIWRGWPLMKKTLVARIFPEGEVRLFSDSYSTKAIEYAKWHEDCKVYNSLGKLIWPENFNQDI